MVVLCGNEPQYCQPQFSLSRFMKLKMLRVTSAFVFPGVGTLSTYCRSNWFCHGARAALRGMIWPRYWLAAGSLMRYASSVSHVTVWPLTEEYTTTWSEVVGTNSNSLLDTPSPFRSPLKP